MNIKGTYPLEPYLGEQYRYRNVTLSASGEDIIECARRLDEKFMTYLELIKQGEIH